MPRKHFALIAHQIRVHGGTNRDRLCTAFIVALSLEYGDAFKQHSEWFAQACGCAA